MRKSVVILFLSFFTLFSFAQENNYYKTKALSFSFNGLNLGSFYGGVGMRQWTNNSTVRDISIGGSISERTYEPEDENYTDAIEKSKSIIVGIGMENHFDSAENISPFIATRLSFSANYRNNFNSHHVQNDPYESKQTTYNFALNFGFGVEYWVSERISFSGQHLFKAYYEMGYYKSGSSENNKQDISGFGLNLGTSSIMLSIYF